MSAARVAPLYLDYAATTPVDPQVAAAMADCLTSEGVFGNAASTTHAYGREAAARIEQARAEVAALIDAPAASLVFTSGATEADNLAVLGVARGLADRGRHLVTMRTEHKAVLDPCRRLEREGWEVSWLEPQRDGRLDPDALRAALRPDTTLVSIMHANNEIGVLQDLPALAGVCRERGVLLHSDAAQSAARLPLAVTALGVDLLSLSAHKLYGPKGVGALYVAPAARAWLLPLMWGGGHERGLRPGTPATHQVVGFGAAARLLRGVQAQESARLAALGQRLEAGLEQVPGVVFNGHRDARLPGLVSVSFHDLDGESLVAALAGELALSSGAACDSATGEPSYVLRALGHSSLLAQATLRLSLGRYTTADDVERAARVIDREVRRLAAVVPRRRRAAGAPGPTPAPTGGDPLAGAAAIGAPAATWRAPDAAQPLPPQVEQLFRDLPLAGAPPGEGEAQGGGEGEGGGKDVWVTGCAGERADGAEVVFHVRFAADGIVSDVRFEAFGCPHTLATAAWIAGQLRGRESGALVPGAPLEWAETLQVPAPKLGRLLTIEDALRAVANLHLSDGGRSDGVCEARDAT